MIVEMTVIRRFCSFSIVRIYFKYLKIPALLLSNGGIPILIEVSCQRAPLFSREI